MTLTPEEEELVKRFGQEFSLLEDKVPLTVTRLGMFCLIGQVQLALRHPQNTGPTRRIAEDELRMIIDQLELTPALQEVVNRGWDPAYDVPVSTSQNESQAENIQTEEEK